MLRGGDTLELLTTKSRLVPALSFSFGSTSPRLYSVSTFYPSSLPPNHINFPSMKTEFSPSTTMITMSVMISNFWGDSNHFILFFNDISRTKRRCQHKDLQSLHPLLSSSIYVQYILNCSSFLDYFR